MSRQGTLRRCSGMEDLAARLMLALSKLLQLADLSLLEDEAHGGPQAGVRTCPCHSLHPPLAPKIHLQCNRQLSATWSYGM